MKTFGERSARLRKLPRSFEPLSKAYRQTVAFLAKRGDHGGTPVQVVDAL
jgi:hypothetical protein